LAAAVKWYELGMVSQSKAAEIAGLSRSEFISELACFSVSPFQYDADEINRENRILMDRWIVNATPLICLAKAGYVDLLLRLPYEVIVPSAVVEEIQAGQSLKKTVNEDW
jgi:hypothetical protein